MLYKGGYRLRFSNGIAWRVCATKNAEKFTQRFAEIMDLRSCDDAVHPLFLFCADLSELDKTNLQGKALFSSDYLEGKDWLKMDMDTVNIYSSLLSQDIVCEIRKATIHQDLIYSMWRSLYPLYGHFLNNNGFPLHGGLAEYQGCGVIFAAPGGAGKSTCCQRLPSHWKVRCDDEAVVFKVNGDYYITHPLPTWSDFLKGASWRSWEVETGSPLHALFFLIQADKDSVVPVNETKAAVLINQSGKQILRRTWYLQDTNIQMKQKCTLFQLAGDMAKQIPVFLLNLSLTGDFWEIVEDILYQKGIVDTAH